MLFRKAEKRITEWIREARRALLVSGARQVGKTTLIRHCLKQEKIKYLEINLIERPELVKIFEQSQTVQDLTINLSAVMNFTFTAGSVLFIDEVQEYPEIVTRVKFWVDEGSYRYILSGSLLGIELRDLRSVPVGYVEELQLFPLDFEEFLKASGVTAETMNYLSECFQKTVPISSPVHDKMMVHFRRYLIVGGMPAAVQEYISSGNLNVVSDIQKNIVEQYKRDFTKNELQERKLMLISVFEQIPSQLLKQNRRFNYSDVQKGLRFERVEDSFLWLSSAGVAIPVYNATEPRVSLNQNKKSSLLKLYSSDAGLLTSQYGNALTMNILTDNSQVNLGGIYENAVAQELHAKGFPLYFYNSHKNGELDFVIEQDERVVPIEVKSGKDYYVHSAISKAVENPEYQIEKAYVLGNCNVSQEDKIINLPVYMTMFIREEITLPTLSLEV